MNKLELVDKLSQKTGLGTKACDKILSQFCDIVKGELKRGGEVTLVGFGKWSVRKRAKRNAYNPHTKKHMTIPASIVPAFKAGKALKMAVNKQK